MPSADSKPRKLYDKVFQDHIVDERPDGTILLHIDRHLVHEVTSPLASIRGLEERRNLDTIAEEANAGREIEVDLINQTVKGASGQKLADLKAEEFRRYCLINGLDDIGLRMQMSEKIKKFEDRRTVDTPWLDGTGYMKRGQHIGPVKIDAAPLPTTNSGALINEPLEW